MYDVQWRMYTHHAEVSDDIRMFVSLSQQLHLVEVYVYEVQQDTLYSNIPSLEPAPVNTLMLEQADIPRWHGHKIMAGA